MSKVDTSPQKISDFLERGVVETITRESVAKKLASGKVLRVKHGVDPSGSELHLGHASVYLKLQDLQEMGHKIIFLIGGFTGRFGDPTDKIKTRTLKSKEEANSNAENYIKQISGILDINKLEIRSNSEWYDSMTAEELLVLMSNFTVEQVLERDMFRERKKKSEPIQLHEIIYPVLQGYDSVRLKSDLTVIGTDQVFNENFGRDLQKKDGQEPQDIVAIKILAGLDGEQKMGKSLNNYISINESAEEQFGKIMSLPDKLIVDYFTLITRLPLTEIKKMERSLAEKSVNPKELKIKLAKEVVTLLHTAEKAQKAAQNFESVFSKREPPDDLAEVKIPQGNSTLLDLVMFSGLVRSKSEARRLIENGAIDIDQENKTSPEEIITIGNGIIIRVGKHRFVKIKTDRK